LKVQNSENWAYGEEGERTTVPEKRQNSSQEEKGEHATLRGRVLRQIVHGLKIIRAEYSGMPGGK